jgi:hypothetical protein
VTNRNFFIFCTERDKHVISLFFQVDPEAVQLMEEDILEKYLPHEGDRVAVRSYAQRCSESDSESQHSMKSVRSYAQRCSESDNESQHSMKSLQCSESESQHKKKKDDEKKKAEDKRMVIIQKLSNSMKFGSENTRESEGASESASSTASYSTAGVFDRLRYKSKFFSSIRKTRNKSNLNATKDSMAVDVGLSVYSHSISRFKQVRSNHGGGIRSIRLPKLVKKQQIIDEAISVFFPKENTTDIDAKKYLLTLRVTFVVYSYFMKMKRQRDLCYV